MAHLWKKIGADGSAGLSMLVGGVVASFRRGKAIPEHLRLRWRLRETTEALDEAYETLGRHVARCLKAGLAVEPSDAETTKYHQRIVALRAEERRLREELAARWAE